MKFDLNGKNALVTGAGGLLGFEHASALAEIGSNLVLTDIDLVALEDVTVRLEKTFPEIKIVSLMMDVTDEENIVEVQTKLKSLSMTVDVLVNNAAVDPKVNAVGDVLISSRLENFSLDQWNTEISVGLTGAFNCCKIFGREMVRCQKGGVILNISSDLSVIAPDQRIYRNKNRLSEESPVKPVTYSVIKTGLIGLTKYLATYWCEDNIRCNALSPGGVLNGQNEEFISELVTRIPLSRMANLSEYRGAIQFLCSDASAYMTGQNLVMDGGRSVW